MARVAPDAPGSAAEAALLAQLTTPYGSTRRVPLTLEEDGSVSVAMTSRYPLLLAALRRDLSEETVRVTATLDPGGPGERVLPPALLAPWSERGASVPLHAPPSAEVPPFTAALRVERRAGSGGFTPVTGADLTALVEVAVLESLLGRLLYTLTQEKQRIRRTAREVAAYRTLAHARRDALDRIGGGVGVARLDDELVHDAGEVFARRRAGGVQESDAAYAARLQPYVRFLVPTRARVAALLADTSRFPAGLSVVEEDDQFAVGVHLVAVGDPAARTDFLAGVRRDRLVLPASGAANNAVHSTRPAATGRAAQTTALRARLRATFAFAGPQAVAPPLAAALDQAARVCQALDASVTWTVERAQDPGAGSRYELGLGLDIAMPTTAQVRALRDAVLATGRAPTADRGAEAVVAGLRAAGVPTAAQDPEAGWLWRACGLATAHRVSAGTLYLSHLPTGGLTVTGPSDVATGATIALTAHLHAPGDPGGNLALVAALAGASDDWARAGAAPWTELEDAAGRTRWAGLPALAATHPAAAALASAELPVVTEPRSVVAALDRVPGELVRTLELAPGLSAGLTAGDPAAAAELGRLVEVLRARHLASVLPLVDAGGRVLLVVGVVGLPAAGPNLTGRFSTGFRWYVVPLGGAAQVRALGSTTALTGTAEGLVAVVVLSYVRTGRTDPYELRVDVPDGTVLSLAQYELLMNTLVRAHPLGVEVNTFDLRRHHVDLDGDGLPDPLPPAVARTFRTYQRRSRGTYEEARP